MVIAGRVENGLVVLEGNACVPEGTQVTVIVPASGASEPARVPSALQREASSGRHEEDMALAKREAAWASFFATKLQIGSAPASEEGEEEEWD